MDVPPIRYAHTSDGVNIAYWMAGQGPPLLWTWQNGFSHIELMCAVPTVPEMLEALMEQHTLVAWDLRNHGLSERGAGEYSVAGIVRDLEAVAARCEHAPVAIAGYQHLLQPMVRFALAHPELVSHIVAVTPWLGDGLPEEFLGPATNLVDAMIPVDHHVFARAWCNAMVGEDDPSMVEPLARLLEGSRSGLSRDVHTEPWRGEFTELLPLLQTPTLILHPRKHPWLDMSQKAAALIPNAQLIVLDLPTLIPGGRIVGETVNRFIAETSKKTAAPFAEQSLRTILFTDLEGHTAMMSRLGDSRGREVLREHERITRVALAAHGGQEVKSLGDGFMASFGSAQHALECAIQLQQQAGSGIAGEALRIRAGINAGEPIVEDNDLFGSSVIAASRIAGRAQGGQVLVADVVRQLAAGKGFLFHDTGEHDLQGLEEPVRLWELRWEQ